MKRLALAVVLALGLFAFAAVPAAAENGKREAEIAYRNIKIVLDGQEICPRDAAGKEVEPFILDGTIYLPVRAVAEALGLEVRWRGSDSTVMLTRDEDEHGFFSVTAVGLPPELPRKAESANGHNAAESVTLGYRDIRVLVDGVVLEPKDAAGNAAEPFTLGGTTYLPVRAVAEALGLAADWDAETSTVRLSHWLVARQNAPFDDGCSASWATEQSNEYDALGRLVHKLGRENTNSYNWRFIYDEDGRVTRWEVTHQELDGSVINSVTSYAYDGGGRCVSAEIKTLYPGESTWDVGNVEYEYDGSGRLVRAVQSSDGKVYYAVEWTYDEAGRVIGIREDWPDTIGASGLPSEGGGTARTFTYDEDGRLTQMDEGGISRVSLSYDGDGRELSCTKSSDAAFLRWSIVSCYDENGRLRRAEYGWFDGELSYAVDYSYDGNGRLIRRETVPEGDGNETLREVCAYFYDESGNLIRLEISSAAGTAVVTREYVKVGG